MCLFLANTSIFLIHVFELLFSKIISFFVYLYLKYFFL